VNTAASFPSTSYARAKDGTHLAYQVFGDGPLDLVLVWGGISHIELMWEDHNLARIFRRLASFSRVIQFDRRGIGLSDRAAANATLEERMEDVAAVMDAARSERAAIFGESEGGPMSALFAATYPERTTALILYGPLVRMIGDSGFPWAPTREVFEQAMDTTVEQWGSEEGIWAWAPSVGDDPNARLFFARFARQSASPGAFRHQMLMNAEIDVRPILPVITVPTLVVHRGRDQVVNVGQGRYAAEHIPGARYVELDGEDHLLIGGDPDALVDEVEEFLTGVRQSREIDRVLATVLFTDIVGSTQLAAELGDRAWRRKLDEHDDVTRRELRRFNGREVKATGDGILATFDGPARAVRCASAIGEATKRIGLDVRAGLHTGECEVRGTDLGGLAVHIAARVGALAGAGEVLVSSTVKDLVVGAGIGFVERGTHSLKGVPGEWRLFAAQA
jgi:class 3 adenylate cyclase